MKTSLRHPLISARFVVVRCNFPAFRGGLPPLATRLAAAAMILSSSMVPAQVQPPRERQEKPPPAIQAMPDGLPALALTKQPAVFSINLVLPDGTGSMNKGFFIDRDGLALCALRYLCLKIPLRFDASDGAILPTPKVQAVFPEQHLALIKFAHQPKAWIELADDRPPVGTWVALISTLRDPAPLTGPILAWRPGSNQYALAPAVIFSFAMGRNPSHSRLFANGAPLMNATGRAVGVFKGAQPLSAQTLRFAYPLDGLEKAIAAALKNPLNLKIPLSKAHHSYDSAWLDPLWNLADQAQMAGDNALALQRVRELIARYPANRTLLEIEWDMILRQSPGPSNDLLLEAVRRTEPPEGAGPAARSAYLYRLGQAYFRTGDLAANMEANRKAFELAPDTAHLAGANLASLHLKRGELAVAESLYRKVISIVPERIDYLEGLQKVLNATGDWQKADGLTPLIYQLEDIYRSR